ncbi:hypothetical protein FSP39_005157 [Pinctada imbricata]|uniref:Angio-associated migratory cell protein n=1 Tax=Pinctada imbricata TaxID=66713 RepID=A0AA88YDU8_PINIB|nr:hypothetical protein FSP39_005157 [Pinctada imbricata]
MMDEEEIVPDDEVEVIEVTDQNEIIAGVVQDLDLYNEDDDDDDNLEDDDEMLEAAGADVEDKADLVFSGHKGTKFVSYMAFKAKWQIEITLSDVCLYVRLVVTLSCEDAVFTVRLSSGTDRLAVTGGQDDKALVWSPDTGEVCLECTGHKDSVTSVGFSYDGLYASSADMSGLVKVWQTNTKKNVWSFECSDIEWLEWHQMAHVLLVGTADGECWMWKVPSGDTKTFQGHGSPASCGRLFNDGKRLAVGYGDGSVKIWDLKSATALHSLDGKGGHTSSVVCIDCHHDNNLVLTGSTDVTSSIINSNSGKVMGAMNCADSENTENSVESCAFSKLQNYAATGTLAGKLHIWDVPTQTCRNTCQHPAGVVKLLWDATQPIVYTACLDGIIRTWDSRNGQLISSLGGHQDSILDFDLSKDGKTLVSVSEDQTARVYKL